MKKINLPIQMLKILISFIISIFIVFMVGDSLLIDIETPKYFQFIEVLVAIFFALLVVIIYDYNEVCRAKSVVKKAKKDVESAIDVRKKLIEKAEKVVDKYVNKETSVFMDYAEARRNKEESASLYRNVTESYPELKSNAAVQKLLTQLEDVERLILLSKNQYTSSAAEHNTIIHTFPVVLVKRLFKWEDVETDIIFEEELVTDEELGI